MINIIGPRGSGKTTKLLKLAQEENAIVLTTNSRAMREKAKALNYNNIEIVGFGDLDNDDFSLGKCVFVDNAELVLRNLLLKFYGLEMIGYNITIEDNNDNKR